MACADNLVSFGQRVNDFLKRNFSGKRGMVVAGP